MELLRYTNALPWGSGQWDSYGAPPPCLRVVGSGTLALHRCSTLLEGSGAVELHSTVPHCLEALGMGSGTFAVRCRSTSGHWAVELPRCTAALAHCPRAIGS